MSEVALTKSGSFDFKNLSEVELEVIVQVIQKDFEIKASEKARLRRRRRKLKEADERVSILANSDFNENFCVICFKRFVVVFFQKRCCLSCRHCMCRDCSVWIPRDKKYICLLCQNERTLKSMGCDWYYGLLKNKFQHDASELVAQSLYSNQGQYSFNFLDSLITPDLLQKVKGVQISRYRQKIQYKWEEMQERLRRLDLSEINTVKREETYRSINEQYKIQFRDILKEFSQVLYITLENYAAKTEDVHLNINEQVMETVHEEVELLIGYKINLIPEEMQSVISDVESTASMFMGNQLEERLAIALINKVNEDHHKVYNIEKYDINCLDNLTPDDLSSSTTYLYRANHSKGLVTNGIHSSCRSSITTSILPVTNRGPVTEYSMDMVDLSQREQNYDFKNDEQIRPTFVFQAKSQKRLEERSDISSEPRSEVVSEVSLSAVQVQRVMKYPNDVQSSLIERDYNVPLGELINLSVVLNGIKEIDIVWTKSVLGRKVFLKNDMTIEIIKSDGMKSSRSNLRIWNSTGSDAGLYTASVNDKPVAIFSVNIIETENIKVKPSFRLKMINFSVRNGQCAEFSVEATGYPEPRLVFYHNNTILNIPSEKFSLEHQPNINRTILKINKVCLTDKGVYKCVASNDSGCCECTAELQVTNLNFRFEKKIPAYEYSSGSSIDDDTPLPKVLPKPDFDIPMENIYDSNASVNQAFEGGKISSMSELSFDPKSDTVIGRELPDDVARYSTNSPFQRYNSLSRSNSIQSEESGDVSPKTARLAAIKSTTNTSSKNSSYVTRLRGIFDQPTVESPFPKSQSIARTPPSGKRRLDTQLTREVRIRKNDYVDD